MNRRELLGAAMAASVLGGAPAVGRSAKAAPAYGPTRIPIGFLGACHSHAADKVQVVRESADFELVGVCEADETVRRRLDQCGVPLVSQAELLERAQVVAVESDVADHARHAQLALMAGKHVHLEKPPADTFEAFRDLVALAHKHKRLMQMGYMWRYHPGINAALEAARKGWLGEVHLVRGTINTLLGPERRPEWGRFPGGVLFELGSHLIDVLVRLLGRPTKVHSALATHGPVADKLADNTVAVFEFPRALGVISSTTLQNNAMAHRRFEILGTQGTAVVGPIEPPKLMIDLAKAAGPYRAGIHPVALPPYRRYVDDFAELGRAVRQGMPLSISPEQDLLVQESLIRASSPAK
jgi:predicted dehydrogenase